MGFIKKQYRDKKIEVSSETIADTLTGEIYEVGNSSTLFARTLTGNIIISSKNYVYLDTDKLLILIQNGIKQVDLAILISLAGNLLIKYNICMMDDKNPHKTSSIAKLTDSTEQSVKIKLNRLVKSGLLYHGTIKEKKGFGKVYIINPHLLRKGKEQSSTLSSLFDDIVLKSD